jgi:putative tryptophan/tyrosine transport system substrate-binding protein
LTDRRAVVLSTALGAMVAMLSARAQASRRLPRVVWQGMGPMVPGFNETVFGPFRAGLHELGYIEGSTILLEFRHVDRKPERLPAAIQESVRQGVDIIVCGSPQIALAAMRVTQTTPIVFAAIIDPVGAGIVQSLAKPGGNATGLAWDADPQIVAKQLQLLRELVPEGRNLALLWNPDVRGSAAFVQAAQAAALHSGVTLKLLQSRTADEIDRAFAGLEKSNVTALIVLGSDFAWAQRGRLASLAASHRLPAIYGNRDSVLAGGLMSYGASLSDQFRAAASYVDRILKGAKPADLPVEQPTKFEFVVNL